LHNKTFRKGTCFSLFDSPWYLRLWCCYCDVMQVNKRFYFTSMAVAQWRQMPHFWNCKCNLLKANKIFFFFKICLNSPPLPHFIQTRATAVTRWNIEFSFTWKSQYFTGIYVIKVIYIAKKWKVLLKFLKPFVRIICLVWLLQRDPFYIFGNNQVIITLESNINFQVTIVGFLHCFPSSFDALSTSGIKERKITWPHRK
jgi:hypothetical protein